MRNFLFASIGSVVITLSVASEHHHNPTWIAAFLLGFVLIATAGFLTFRRR